MMSTLDCTLVLMTCISSPVTALLIERMAKKKRASLVRSVEQYMSNPNPTTTELRLLACVYNQDNVPSLLNILDISHLHKRTTPICFYLLQLVELVGSGAPILSPHQHPHRSTSHHSNFDKILTTFRKHEKHCGAAVSVQPFTSVSPFETMHQDVCSLAAEKKVSLIVIPFHKKIGMGGAEARLRLVAQKIMAEVLCSVGILVDNGPPNYFAVGWEAPDKRAYRVGILFLGGQDDREALAYVLRVADHPRADITVLRILGAYDSAADDIKRERLLDDRAVGDFRLQTLEKKKVVYREEWVKNAEDIVVAVQSMGSHFDLMVVGRRHKVHSKIMNELLDWSEYVELGVIGDMLAAPDFAKFAMAILVVQQSMGAGEVVKEKETVPGTPSATTSASETAVAPSTRRLPEPR